MEEPAHITEEEQDAVMKVECSSCVDLTEPLFELCDTELSTAAVSCDDLTSCIPLGQVEQL